MNAFVSLRSTKLLCGVLAASVVLALAGCGGGGGGGISKSGITYVTDWSARVGAPITGESQRVTLMAADGSTIATRVISAGTAAKSQLRLDAPAGTYRIRVELNSAPNFGGTISGVAEASVIAGQTLETAVGPALASLRVEPSDILVGKGASVRLSAAARTADGRYAFVAPNAVTWTTTGSAATIGADGTLTGTEFGNGQVTARHPASGKAGTTNFQTAVEGARRSKWTVLVFLSAANNLYPYAPLNMNQMERVTNDDVRFVAQWKQAKKIYPSASFDGTRRYLVKPDNTDEVRSELVENMGDGVDMGKAETLRDFIAWGKAHYPAERYSLVIWSHGDGWAPNNALTVPVRATSYDDEFASSINVWDLPRALAGEHFDILSFDACLMQMLEVASELRPYCDYISASAENTPAAGYPYDRVFGSFASNPDAPTLDLANAYVTGHVGNPSYKNQAVTQSVVDTSRIPAVESALDGFAASLIANAAAVKTAVPEIRSAAQKYGNPGDGRFFYDLTDIANRFKAHSAVPAAVKTAAQAVIDAQAQAVRFTAASKYDAFSTGLSIDFSPSTNARLSRYSNLNLAKVTRWGTWLMSAP